MNTVADLLERFMDQEGLYSTEGRRGVDNLATVVRTLGYTSIPDFLEDNPGAIEAIYEWIDRFNDTEWANKIKSHLHDAGSDVE